MLTGTDIIAAADPTRPQLGEVVRTSHTPFASVVKSDHRDIRITGTGVSEDGRHYVTGVSLTAYGPVTIKSFETQDGTHPQFRRAAPAGPYTDPEDQNRWRAGYTDAISHIGRYERFAEPRAAFREGYAAGLADRARFVIVKPSHVGERGTGTGMNSWTARQSAQSQAAAA